MLNSFEVNVLINRRALMAFLGAGAVIRTSASNAQQTQKPRTVGVLMGLTNDEENKPRAAAIEQGLAKRGWVAGQNLKLEYRFAGGDSARMRSLSKELVELGPDVIIGHSTPVVAALHETTQTVPIVFVVVADPVGSGFVASLAHPGGNITGFTVVQPSITGKYLSILREVKPNLTRVALMYNPDSVPGGGVLYTPSFVESAKEFGVTPIVAPIDTAGELETFMNDFGTKLGSALIVMPGNFTTLYRGLIISLAARLRIPTLYPYRYFANEGGLLSYGIDVLDLFRRTPDYVDRILRGANPGNLPVQAPRKFELVINMKAAKSLGIVVPRILLAGADALIN
jgi:putative ABC transport system substrate-binding protein